MLPNPCNTLFLPEMNHEKYMQRCLGLAANGKGSTSPNPMVGSVMVFEDRIIGEGWHQKPGAPHAEVNAINNVSDKELLGKSTLYVNLEPCAHFGKTPPCSDLIIEKKIPKVVIGCRDPFSEVNGRGVEKLRDAGVEVIEGVLRQDCEDLNRRFFTYHTKKRPYIILKWAQTADGFMDRDRQHQTRGVNWITTPETRTLVHHWRAEEDAIMVGAQTVINDNPALTVRDVKADNPVRIVLNTNKKIPANSSVFDGEAETLYFSSELNPELSPAILLSPAENAIPQVLAEAYKRGIQSILVEGGAYLLKSFLESELWDEARVFTGNKYFGAGLKAPKIHKKPAAEDQLGVDRLQIYYP